jgi:putative ABC transport system permease protein
VISSQSIWRDLQVVLRAVRRRPIAHVSAALALTAGIAVSTPIISYLEHVFLRQSVFRDSAELVLLAVTERATGQQRPWAEEDIAVLSGRHSVFAGVGHFTPAGTSMPEGGSQITPITWCFVSPNLFQVLGVTPILGDVSERLLDGTEPTAVISHHLWRTLFGSDPAVVGRHLSRAWNRYRVLAVMPDGFRFPASGADVWVPYPPDRPAGSAHAHTVARVRRGTRLEEVRRAVTSAYRQHGLGEETDPLLMSLNSALTATPRRALPLLVLAVASALLLSTAVACHLMFADALSAQTEIGVKLALGASRMEALRVFWLKGLVISIAAGGFGLPLSMLIVRLQDLSALDASAVAARSLDWRVAVIVTALCILMGLAVGATSVAASLGRAIPVLLHSDHGGASPAIVLLRRAVLSSQVCCGTVFLVFSALTWQSMQNLGRVSPGFSTGQILTLTVATPHLLTMKPAEMFRGAQYFERIVDGSRRLPGVSAVAATSGLPVGASMLKVPLRVPANGPKCSDVQLRVVSSDYFKVLGVPMLEGRSFATTEGSPLARVAIINETLARHCWPNRSALDQYGSVSSRSYRIVGVVGNTRTRGLRAPVPPEIFVPMGEMCFAAMCMVMRVEGSDLHRPLPDFRRLLADIDSEAQVTSIRSLDEVMSGAEIALSSRATLLGIASLTTLLIAVLGVYAAAVHVVHERRRNLAIRLALGASPVHLGIRVIAGLVASAIPGVLGGLALAYWGAASLAQVLFEVRPYDCFTYCLSASVVLLLSVLAAFVAARLLSEGSLSAVLRCD